MNLRAKSIVAEVLLLGLTAANLFQDRLHLPLYGYLLLAGAQLFTLGVIFDLRKQRKALQPVPASSPPRVAPSRIVIFGIMPISALASPFLVPLAGSSAPQKYILIVGLLFTAVLLPVALWRLAQERIRLTDHRVLAVSLGFIMLALASWDATTLMRNFAIGRIGKAMQQADAVRLAKGPSFASAEEFIATVKAIDTGNAPADFKQALDDYTRGQEDGIAALKANDQAKALAASLITQDAQSRLVAIAGKY